MNDAETVLLDLIARTNAPLAHAQAEHDHWAEEISKIQFERYGLELALARLRGEPQPALPETPAKELPATPTSATPTSATPDQQRWRRMSRADAIVQVLADEGRPLDRREIFQRLTAVGRTDDDLNGVSASLAHLRRYERVAKFGAGQWELRQTDIEAADETVATPENNRNSPSEDVAMT